MTIPPESSDRALPSILAWGYLQVIVIGNFGYVLKFLSDHCRHINSIDKSSNGDYFVSARFSNAIYLISGIDGTILWRLGGKHSDFVLNGFRFYRQHDAHFVSVNSTHIIIYFLNNAADDISEDDSHSYGRIVQLNIAIFPMTAVTLAQYDRPEWGFIGKRGNLQVVSNGNVVVGWFDRSYVIEFTAGGSVVMEASLTWFGYDTYRAYKFDIQLVPAEAPALKAFASDLEKSVLITICYVSSNGATEVAS